MNIDDFTRPIPLRERIRLALAEDLSVEGDVTSTGVFAETAMARATVIAKDSGVVCGTQVFAAVFAELGGVEVDLLMADATHAKPGDVVMRLAGATRSILSGERTALNLLQQLSGVATMTSRFVAATRGRVAICDTRKTTPLWRDLQKYAVVCGGGTNHRMGLFDMVMLKDTHADGAGSLEEALRRVEPLRPRLRVAAEARDLTEVQAALDAKVDLLMLDNMDETTLAAAVKLIAGRALTEVTGGITVERAHLLADIGIDRVSVGALTHSAPAMDFSLRLALG